VGSFLGSLMFIMYKYDLPLRNSLSEPILVGGDTSVIISSINFEDFSSVQNLVLLYDEMICFY